MSDIRTHVARAIWKVKPDCDTRPFPHDVLTPKEIRALQHNPIASLDLCFIYADAAIAAISSAPATMESLSVEKAEAGAEATITTGDRNPRT
jgi:hypothetical protein